MSESKKKTKATESELIAKARKKRLALAKEPTVVVEKSDQREDFRVYFLQIRSKLNLDRYLEEVIWSHLKAIKHDKKDLFKAGIENFGYIL